MNLKKDRGRVKLLKTLERVISYRFKDKKLLNQALTHKSYANERYQKTPYHNERLEFLGDAILGAVISRILYDEYPEKDEGTLTRYKSQLVSGATLERLAKKLELGQFLLLGKGEEACGGRKQSSNLLCALEAIIGSVYLDSNVKNAHKFIQHIYQSELDLVKKGKGTRDYKSLLQQTALKRFKTIPVYKIISAIGPDHKKHFIVEVSILGKRYGVGSGSNKKSAEQGSAKEALAELKSEEDPLSEL